MSYSVTVTPAPPPACIWLKDVPTGQLVRVVGGGYNGSVLLRLPGGIVDEDGTSITAADFTHPGYPVFYNGDAEVEVLPRGSVVSLKVN